VRTRLALRKQDDITRLEEQLDTIDREEMHDLYLGCYQKDMNQERQKLVQELTTTLSEYGMESILEVNYRSEIDKIIDKLLKDCQQALQYPHAMKRDISSLKNWLDGTGCIALRETAYLDHDDLIHLLPLPDEAITKVESVIEDCCIKISAMFGWVRVPPHSLPLEKLGKIVILTFFPSIQMAWSGGSRKL